MNWARGRPSGIYLLTLAPHGLRLARMRQAFTRASTLYRRLRSGVTKFFRRILAAKPRRQLRATGSHPTPWYLRPPYSGHRLQSLPGLQVLKAGLAPGSANIIYVEHAQEKIWIADYAAEAARRALQGPPTVDRAPWGMTVPISSYVFACIGELTSALDNLAFVANRKKSLGVADKQIDFPRLAKGPDASLVAFRATAAGVLSTEFYEDPWTVYLFELRNHLMHHVVVRQYEVALTVGQPPGYGLVLPAPGAPMTSGGGPSVGDALSVFVEIVSCFADEFGSSL